MFPFPHYLRVVPRKPDPEKFVSVPFACDVRPGLCHECIAPCDHGRLYSRLQSRDLREEFHDNEIAVLEDRG